MKLELKHFIYQNYKPVSVFVGGTIDLITELDFENKIVSFLNLGNRLLDDCGFKLILHPLSDLTEEIEVNGEKFIPIVELAEKESANNNIYVKDIHSSKDIFWVDFENSEEDEFRFCYCINSFQKGKLNPNSHTFVQNQIELWNMLLSWHFDIFGLIDARLAVDINTVKF